jgi:two-component system, LuxR family, sensor kinase FixL
MSALAGSHIGRWPANAVARSPARTLSWIVALSLAYYATAVFAHLELRLPAYPSITLLWMPNVLLLVAMLVTPLRVWPVIVLAAVVTQVGVAATLGFPLARALGMFVGNLSQALIAAPILRRVGPWQDQLDTVRGVTWFIAVAALGAPALASTLASVVLMVTGWISDPWLYWRVRLVTNVLSTLVLVPPVLVFVRARRLPRPLVARTTEFALLLLCLAASERLAVTLATPLTASPLLFAPLPFLLWASVRFGPAGLGLVLCFTALFRYFADSHPSEQFVVDADAIIATQLTLIAMSLPLMYLSALLTERRRSEEELRTGHARYGLATKAGSVGVWDWNLDTNDIYVDPALKVLLGYDDAEIRNHLDEWGQRVHPDDGPRVMAAAQAHIDGQSPAFECPHRMLHKDGSIRWFLARGVIVERRDGRATRIIGTDTDITLQKQAEQALEDAKIELARLTRLSEMGGLTATIAHEVNQPLCAIVANAGAALRWLGREDTDVTQVRAALEDVVRDGKRASELIRRMRGLFERGEIDRQPTDLNQIIQNALGLTRATVEAGGVSADTELDPSLPPVRGDQVQLQQVFCNLIVNAVEAMQNSAGAATLRITTGRRDGAVFAAVSDSGAGLDGDPERVFRPLVTTRPDGMGIGLSMSRVIVEMHGGRLWATRNDGAGATFHVVLPLSEMHV